jgi:putative membrane protein
MLRTLFCGVLLLAMATVVVTASQDTKATAGNGQQATVTKVDAKQGTVTVRMKDKNGKEIEKSFMLTGDIRYFDSTGKAVAIDIFQSGDDVLFVEAEGRLKEMRRGHGAQAKSDREFLKAAAQIDLAEMKLGKLAQERASAAAIKKFGERLVADHSKMNKELEMIAKSHGMTLPDNLDQKHQELVDQLSKMNGAAFDRAFTKDLTSGHEAAIKQFDAEAKSGQDADLKAWAERWLPTLREHLEQVRTAAKQLD